MTTKREFRNGELVDITYDENGEEILWHWVCIPRYSGRCPWPKTIANEKLSESEDALDRAIEV